MSQAGCTETSWPGSYPMLDEPNCGRGVTGYYTVCARRRLLLDEKSAIQHISASIAVP
jgi:hypothetical protein